MKRKIYAPLLTSLCILLLLASPVPGQDPLISINKIEVQPGMLTTKLVFRTDALLPIQTTYYALQQPQTLVIDVGQGDDDRDPPALAGRIRSSSRISRSRRPDCRPAVHPCA